MGEWLGRGSLRRMSCIAASSSEITLAEVGVGVGRGGSCTDLCWGGEEKFTRMRLGWGGAFCSVELAASRGRKGRF
jgi:hypothetical protein